MRGGARNRSGPAKDPASARSDQLGYRLTALPPEGFQGPVPRWPLPRRELESAEETRRVAARERAMWRWAWRTPQAWGWAQPQEAWRLPVVAMWVRTFVICEGTAASAADKNSLHRFADQIGLTPAGLKENGWQVARDQVAEKRAEQEVEELAARSSRDRMKVIKGGRG